ncbi:MAG: type II secretion system protein GspJ [Planctomycetota bacterium]|jgi:type II secretion system protein J
MRHAGEKVRPPTAGFTLLELMLALSLMALLMGGVYEILTVARRSQNQAMDTVRLDQVGRAALKRIRNDLESLCQAPSPLNTGLYAEDGETTRGAFTFPGDYATFLSASRVARLGALRQDPDNPENVPVSDLIEIEYYIGTDPDEEGQGLIRRVKTCLNTTLTDEDQVWEPTLIAEEVVGLNFRYWDGEAWEEEWDTETEEGFPEAVEVTLTVGRVLFEDEAWVVHYPNGEETARKTFTMVVPLRPKPPLQMNMEQAEGGGAR